MASTMKNWNLTVQWWISTYVHRKLLFKNKNVRQAFVFLLKNIYQVNAISRNEATQDTERQLLGSTLHTTCPHGWVAQSWTCKKLKVKVKNSTISPSFPDEFSDLKIT